MFLVPHPGRERSLLLVSVEANAWLLHVFSGMQLSGIKPRGVALLAIVLLLFQLNEALIGCIGLHTITQCPVRLGEQALY